MRIPLDYYRILGLPIQATTEQLSQAYRDRAQQLPRREYSEVAIAARKELLDEAYTVLSNSEERAVYDTNFLARTYDLESSPQLPPASVLGGDTALGKTSEPQGSSIEIKTEQLVGGLLILQELGEYEIVLQLATPYLGKEDRLGLDRGKLGNPQLVKPDIILTLALACLELGREQWQRGEYENAALSLETGQDFLLKEGIFATVRGEIQTDLYKLRPYRILELLALPDENIEERRKGLQLLQDMLQERLGIDGTGDDRSGLSIDDFLRFIQQLRGYLTSAQQQTLFEAESKRPSAVATYLAVYALVARGFAERQPALIARGKQMLIRLGKRQDVHLEQSVCALLLGQTEEASRALELSQEYEPLAFIRENSQGSPDLLPGLCLYGERWLQNSVFPHFRDLAKKKASLKEYFADEQVQAYLESMPDSTEQVENQWTVESQQKAYSTSTGAKDVGAGNRVIQDPLRASTNYPKGEERRNGKTAVVGSRLINERESVSSSGGGTATIAKSTSGVSTLPPESGGSSPSNRDIPGNRQPVNPFVGNEGTSSSSRGSQANGKSGLGTSTSHQGNGSYSPSTVATKSGGSQKIPIVGLKKLPNRFKSLAKMRSLVIIAIAGLFGSILLGWGLKKALNSSPKLEGEQPMVQVNQPPIQIPPPGSELSAPGGPLTEETAQQTISTWLSTKALAMGREHQVERLNQILTNPILATWRQRAEAAKEGNSNWQYNHKVQVTGVQTNPTNLDVARVEAAVSEEARLYQGGELDRAKSYSENLRVEYELIRQQGKWLIRDMKVK
ncbi:MAG TPA: molecular chaperone DnaJ [Cyanobacteria bacterium UBA11149]|nr:molecular chaperone DnaJ [Cyanobacteria bacterium UBA11367]HBE59315.1 molecular chaperone DnaJ [Cyanobacteria bacterium UBA11366]HBR73731.1 molecular chaperone DnaJ [Cyanobacteria bacterium UBA11159]HBS68158.1 molecular chaperone DnaJ [Cyanobacteria bacterium UBA11153]HBW90911.1 molecular chaperone DnaJ [Cyanobacteria bacterium UBA11149]HCA95307.1 molecular chaperone DnaJ [Cyanobacteria bacterium UBA9226]